MKKAKDKKERLYKDRIQNVEGGASVPLIFTTKGARSYQTSKTIAKLRAMIASEKKETTSETIKKLPHELSYAFLRSELACIRGEKNPDIMITMSTITKLGL